MKKILLGVTGGIAAYKAANFTSLLKKKGYEVKVIMTENATKIITPLTLETLSKNVVYVDMWHEKSHYEVEHISLAHWADVVVVLPATYNIVGKIANGIADDMLSTVIAATNKPVFFALAMNVQMYENPILYENIQKLKKYHYHFIEAAEGMLACEDIGKGKLEKEEEVIWEIEAYFLSRQLAGKLEDKKVLITGGPTEEAIDPIRYISNRSSGKMAYALAKAAVAGGAKVSLISGPTKLQKPRRLEEFVSVRGAREMYQEVEKRFEHCDIFVSCSAVADYRPKEYSPIKIKKKEGDLRIDLERNPDILLEMGKRKSHQILIGFAAETNDIEENANRKLEKKNLDCIVANDSKTMNQEKNTVSILKKGGNKVEIQEKVKEELAYDIWKNIL